MKKKNKQIQFTDNIRMMSLIRKLGIKGLFGEIKWAKGLPFIYTWYGALNYLSWLYDGEKI